jgi:K+-sensing histidine kinase KdpD
VSPREPTALRDALKPYCLAVVTVGLALPAALGLWPLTKPTIAPIFLGAVMVSAWVGGLRGGLLATALASLAMDYFFLEPVHSVFSFAHHGDALRLGVFVLVAVLISSLNGARRRAAAVLAESRRFLQSTLDSLTARIAIIDGRGTIVEVNDAWRRFDAASCGSRGVGSDYLSAYTVASGDAAARARAASAGIREVLECRRDTCSAELPEGEGWFLVRATRFALDGEVRVVVSHEDITERRRAEEAERKAEALRSVARLAVAAAHEINNPLAAIRGNLELLGRQVGAEVARTRLQPAFDAVDRIRTIVASMGNITELRVAERWPTLPEMLDLRRSSPSPPKGETSGGSSPAPPSA